jgi:hypothetical protein
VSVPGLSISVPRGGAFWFRKSGFLSDRFTASPSSLRIESVQKIDLGGSCAG